jgi:hypothetical protein
MSPFRKEPGITALKKSVVQMAGEVALGEQGKLEAIVKEGEDSLGTNPTTKSLMELEADLPAEQRLRDGTIGLKTFNSDSGLPEAVEHKLGVPLQSMLRGQEANRRATVRHIHRPVRQSFTNQVIGV